MLLRYCEEALSARRPNANPLRIAVENAIPPLLPHGRARIGVVARQLGLSSRTLRRRLADEGLNFSELLDQLRADLATSYLRESSLGVSQIAWLVGYRGVSAFTHACSRWTGMTPGQFKAAAARSISARAAMKKGRAHVFERNRPEQQDARVRRGSRP
jgi:AraC-like DNA-binding protein